MSPTGPLRNAFYFVSFNSPASNVTVEIPEKSKLSFNLSAIWKATLFTAETLMLFSFSFLKKDEANEVVLKPSEIKYFQSKYFVV